MYLQRNIAARSGNYCCCERAIRITYSECVSVDLVNQHAKRMRRVILSPVACLTLPFFSHHLMNGTIFEPKKIIEFVV
jgi:hypothetical protein